MRGLFLPSVLIVGLIGAVAASSYTISDAGGLGRTLDGIGGLSGGGATSVLLWTYPEPQRSEILDFLFKPNFGAALHILKVEIGGDAQSTDGAESSHMHTPWDENYERGYEWWLMREAKKRNPNIKLYGLSWAFPQWVTCAPGTLANCTNNIYDQPQVTATYVTKWVAGALLTHNLTIDYVGSWNERAYNDTYLKVLRSTLDAAGFQRTKIVAPDGSWDLANDILADPALADAIYGIGAHYPGTVTTPQALETGKPLWASEDDSTYNNNVGAGCWARILNQNYVNGNMTATINWNLVAAYTKGTNWYRAGLMSAMQPWVASYGSWHADGTWTAGPMIWASAHTTQFTGPEPHDWAYLLHRDGGAAHLSGGGSYVTLKNMHTNDVTIVIEKMSRDYSSCVRPYLANYTTSNETAVFQLEGTLQNITALHLWYTHWAYWTGDTTVEFSYRGTVPVVGGLFQLALTVNSLYTLTTLATGNKGAPPVTPQQPALFPSVFVDDLESCRISGEARYFADQNGIFECVESGDARHGIVMQQQVPLRPVTWGGDIRPHSLLGHRDTRNMSFSVDAFITEPGASVLLGVRIDSTDNAQGILWSVDTTGVWNITNYILTVASSSVPPIASGVVPQPLLAGSWNRFRLDVNGTNLSIWMNGFSVLTDYSVANFPLSGHALIGTVAYGQYTQYDNFELYSTFQPMLGQRDDAVASPGDSVCVAECNSEVGLVNTSQWLFHGQPNTGGPGQLISLRHQPELCLTAVSNNTEPSAPWWLQVQPCNASSPLQLWDWMFDGIAPDVERVSYLYLPASSRCLDIYQTIADIGNPMDAWPCNLGANQAFWFDFDAAEIGNEATATCLGVCRRS